MSQANNDQVTNVIVKDVEIYWPKLVKPEDPFGTLQYSIQARFPKKRVTEMEEYGTVKEVKDEKGVFSMNFKKKAELADGSPAKKVKVVDRAGNEIDAGKIGNGSKGNLKLMLKPYQIKGPKGNVTKEGTSVMLIAVQITDLVVYEPKGGNDFDYDDEQPVEPPASARSGPKEEVKRKPGRPAKAQQDDDIPF